jgi:hypothetical protein
MKSVRKLRRTLGKTNGSSYPDGSQSWQNVFSHSLIIVLTDTFSTNGTLQRGIWRVNSQLSCVVMPVIANLTKWKAVWLKCGE